VTHALGDDQRAERLGITRKIAEGIERHVIGVTRLRPSPKRRTRRAAEMTHHAPLLRRPRRAHLDLVHPRPIKSLDESGEL
jgi:hypothetical protein